jgi:hypothetical protein
MALQRHMAKGSSVSDNNWVGRDELLLAARACE